jgi:hypothetical protein
MDAATCLSHLDNSAIVRFYEHWAGHPLATALEEDCSFHVSPPVRCAKTPCVTRTENRPDRLPVF